MTAVLCAIIDTSTDIVVNITFADPITFTPPAGDIIIASNTAGIGWSYDPSTGDFSPPPPTLTDEMNNLENTYYAALITVAGNQYSAGQAASFLPQVITAMEAPATDTLMIFDVNGTEVNITAADIITLYLAMFNQSNAITYATAQVSSAIAANTITTNLQVDTAFATAYAAAPQVSSMTTAASLAATATALAATVAGKVDKITGKGLSTNDLTAALLIKLNALAVQLQADYAETNSASLDFVKNKPKTFVGAPGTAPVLRASPINYIGTATVSSGSVVIQLTDTGLSTGGALFANGIDTVNAWINGVNASFIPVLTNGNKTLTISEDAITSVLGILSLTAPSNGVTVDVDIKGW